MVLPQFECLAPKTMGEAYNLLLEFGGPAEIMAGVTGLIPPMKNKAISPEYLIDLKKISDLDHLEYDEKEGLEIGTLTALRTIEVSPSVKGKNPAMAYAVEIVASTQIRARDIMAGNICNASPSCDTAPNLSAQGAKILVQGPNRDRIVRAEDFFLGVKKALLESGEIVTGIVIPPLIENEGAVYTKHAVRKTTDLIVIDATIKIKMEDSMYTDAHTALGAVAVTPTRAPKAEEALVGEAPTDEVIVKASEEAMDSYHPISNIHTSARYHKDVIRVSTERAVRQTTGCL